MLPAHYSDKKESRYFCRFTFGQFFTILVLEIFTLFFVFYLGSRYGRELFGMKTLPATAETRSHPLEVTTIDPNLVATTHDPEIKALAKDILEQAPSSGLKQRVEEMLEASGRKKESGQRPATRGVTKDSGPTVKEEPVVAAEKPQPVIETVPNNAPYSIQVGSYPNPDQAHEMVNSWKEKGYDAYLLSAEIPDKGRWYRVRLGAFNTKEEAQNYLDAFKMKESTDAFVSSNF